MTVEEVTPSDPLVGAIAATLEQVLERGLTVTPTTSGWLIRLETDVPRGLSGTKEDSPHAVPTYEGSRW